MSMSKTGAKKKTNKRKAKSLAPRMARASRAVVPTTSPAGALPVLTARLRSGAAAEIERPTVRPLKAYAFDPSQGRLLGNEMSIPVRYQDLEPGPVVRDPFAGNGVAVVDYDATHDVYYTPVDLDDPRVLIRGGFDPIESDPRFHQQMVYAVVTETIQHFEAALGRRIHWRRIPHEEVGREEANRQNIYTLTLFPHAMVDANAYYSPRAHGILFGYFRANESAQGRNLPGQLVYTCLSHDIVVHETTHAILDGIRRHFMEQTNPDVAAFHEGFADIVALFRHFSHSEVLLDTVQRTGGRLFDRSLAPAVQLEPGAAAAISNQIAPGNPLVELAQQFGEAQSRGHGLRSALETPPNSNDILTKFECHERGAILVAAIFDAYFTIYQRRTADLFRVYRAGGGNLSQDLPLSLAQMLATQASRTAALFFTVCVRALDYCPAIDITFGDYLRALITSDFDLHPTDEAGLRDALMQAFRVRGIVPDGADSFSDRAIAWPRATGLPPVLGLVFGDPNGLTRDEQDACKTALVAYVQSPAVRDALGLEPQLDVIIPSFHPVFRVEQDGSLRTDMVVQMFQNRPPPADGESEGTFPMRSGVTLVISKPPLSELRRRAIQGESVHVGYVRYVISKPLHGTAGEAREQRQRHHLQRIGLLDGTDPQRFEIDFAIAHGGL
ncbi:MAG TPA: hypothetical protein VHB79_31005 [Polyangiaceae bacterium]|nr:hypothetical protein [Polyangiaceae bacterium]